MVPFNMREKGKKQLIFGIQLLINQSHNVSFVIVSFNMREKGKKQLI